MAKQNKTTATSFSVTRFLNTVTEKQKREDSFAITEIMKKQTGFEPVMWGPAIIGFGKHHYKYESGREGDAPLVGFSPRKNAITLYLSSAFEGREKLLSEFGKHKTSKACIYIKSLRDINIDVLKKMISLSVKSVSQKCG